MTESLLVLNFFYPKGGKENTMANIADGWKLANM